MEDYAYVYEVYRDRSFSKAARRLYLSQPALSAAVKKAERELGAPIFDRSVSPIQLTEEGKVYIEAAEKMMRIRQEMLACVDDMSHLHSGRITVAGTAFYLSYVIPIIVKAFSSLYPGVELHFTEADSLALYQDDGVDLIVDSGRLNRKLFAEQPLFQEQILLAVPQNDPINEGLKEQRLRRECLREDLQEKEGVSLELFREKAFILLKREHDLHARAIALCRESGFQPERALYLNQLMTAYHIGGQGLGCVFVTDTLVRVCGTSMPLYYYKIKTGRPQLTVRQVFVAHKNGCYVSHAMRRFMEIAASLFQENWEDSLFR